MTKSADATATSPSWSLASDRRGTIAVLTALLLPIVVGAGALVVDVGQGYAMRTKLQTAADAAALAAMSEFPDHAAMVDAARSIVAKNLPETRHGDALRPELVELGIFDRESRTFTPDGAAPSSVRVTVQRNLANGNAVRTFFASLLGSAALDLRASSIAGMSREPACLMAMHETRKHTFELDGAVRIMAPDCHIYANSTHPNDVVDPHSPDNYVTAKSVQAMGYGHNYLQNVTPRLEYAPERLGDPLAGMEIPHVGPCNHTLVNITGGTRTLSPGVYCKGLRIDKGATVTLEPGQYFLTEKDFQVIDSTLEGHGVTIFLVDWKATIEWQRSTIDLKAPKTGEFAGIVVFGTRVEADHEFYESEIQLGGLFYVPMGNLEWNNKDAAPATPDWTAMIVSGFHFGGEGVINLNFRPTDSDIPYPAALRIVPRGGIELLQ